MLLALGASAQERSTLLRSELLARGYEALAESPGEALPYFEEIVHRDSSDLLAQRQLGSILLSLDRVREALAHFQSAYRLLPTDSTLLQIAYLYNRLGEDGKALALFGLLRRSRIPSIASTARSAIDILTPLFCEGRSRWWTRASGSVYYDDRFEDLIASLSFSGGRYLTEDHILSLYGILTLNADSRSTGGAQPVIYSDNYALAGGGLRIQPLHGIALDLQGGASYDLLERHQSERVSGDFRALLSLGGGFYAPVEVPLSLRAPLHPFADGFLSAGYYSRYTNGIGYSQVRAGLRTLTLRHTALDLYLRGDFTFDTRRDFFNNTAEGSLGARLIPDHRWGIALLAEYHRGFYWVTPPSTPTWYNSFRILLVVDRYLCL
jgi:hypothetical protein